MPDSSSLHNLLSSVCGDPVHVTPQDNSSLREKALSTPRYDKVIAITTDVKALRNCVIHLDRLGYGAGCCHKLYCGVFKFAHCYWTYIPLNKFESRASNYLIVKSKHSKNQRVVPVSK